MTREDIYRYVLGKIKKIHPTIDDLDNVLDILELELREAGRLPDARRFLSIIRNAKSLLENISEEIDEMEHEVSERPQEHTNPPPPPFFSLTQIHKLRIVVGALGTAEVFIDDLVPFSLPPNLASLLEFLAMDDGIAGTQNGNDPLVPFKNIYWLLLNMTKILGGKPYTKHALRQSVYRLRKIMADNGFNGLIQTNRQLGAYRVALRRKNYASPDEDKNNDGEKS